MHPDIIAKFGLQEVDAFLPEMHNAYKYGNDVFICKMTHGSRIGLIKFRWIANGNYHDTFFTEEFILDMPIDFINKLIKNEKADLELKHR